MFNQSVISTEETQNTQEKCIHAILVEKNIGISELWLPSIVEGRYTFPIAEDAISIIAEDSWWKACVAKGGYFSVMDSGREGTLTQKNEIILQSNSLNVAHIGDATFSLFLEDDCGGNRVFEQYYL